MSYVAVKFTASDLDAIDRFLELYNDMSSPNPEASQELEYPDSAHGAVLDVLHELVGDVLEDELPITLDDSRTAAFVEGAMATELALGTLAMNLRTYFDFFANKLQANGINVQLKDVPVTLEVSGDY